MKYKLKIKEDKRTLWQLEFSHSLLFYLLVQKDYFSFMFFVLFIKIQLKREKLIIFLRSKFCG